jgi:glycerol-3-phosphate dehydrogenase (NAD(P)+)
MNIAFIGLGKFGQAIASLVEENGLTYDYAEVAESRLLSQSADIIFLTVPTQFMRQAITDNKQYIDDDTIIVNCSKGIEEGSHLMVHQIVRSLGRYPNYYSLIGPSFAEGIVDREPTVVSLGYKNEAHVATIQAMLQTPYLKVQPSRGYRSLELSSALKNLYAITCGYAQGLGFGPNTRARLINMALDEFHTLAKAMHFADYDLLAPGVVGDLVLTCSSEQSRNFQYGLSLASGNGNNNDPGQKTVEGYYTSHSINTIAKNHGAKLPLAELTSQIITGKIDGPEAFRSFLASC